MVNGTSLRVLRTCRAKTCWDEQALLAVPSPSARDSGRRPICESHVHSWHVFGAHTPWWACVQKDYAQEIADKLSALGLFADVDNGADTLPKKIRNGEIAQYNFLLGALGVLSFADLFRSS